MHRVAERFEHVEPCAVAAGVRHRETAGGDDHGVGLEHRAVIQRDLPAGVNRRDIDHTRFHPHPHAHLARVVQQPIAHITGLVRRGKELERLDFFFEGNAQRMLEKGALFGQRPGAYHFLEQIR